MLGSKYSTADLTNIIYVV